MTKLVALLALKGEEKESEKVRLLDSMGFRPTDIANILNKSLSNVTTTLTNIRKKALGAKELDKEAQQAGKQEKGESKG